MSRAIIIPTPVNPVQLNFWLRCYDHFIQGEVDQVYVSVAGPCRADVLAWCKAECARRGFYLKRTVPQLQHGDTINQVLDDVQEDHVVLMEDDLFVFKRGQLDFNFRKIEEGWYDVVGSARGFAADGVAVPAKRLYRSEANPDGYAGLWPCLLFTKTETLRQTDRNFNAIDYQPGDRPPGLGVTLAATCSCDTFVHASLQLRAKGLRIGEVDQYKLNSTDVINRQLLGKFWGGLAGWTHVGSLSGGLMGMLRDERRYSLQDPGVVVEFHDLGLKTNLGLKKDVSKRYFWWRWFLEFGDFSTIPQFAASYRHAVDEAINFYGISEVDMAEYEGYYREIFGNEALAVLKSGSCS